MFVTLTLFYKVYQTVKKYTSTSPNILTCMPYQVSLCRCTKTIFVICKMSRFQSRSRTQSYFNCAVLINIILKILQVFRAILHCSIDLLLSYFCHSRPFKNLSTLLSLQYHDENVASTR